MTPKSRPKLAALTAMTLLAACTPPAGDEPVKSMSTEVATSSAVTSTADTLLAYERQALEAYIKGDGGFFEKILSDNFVMQIRGSRLSKAEVVGMIAGVQCDVRDGWALTEPQVSEIDDDIHVITYKVSIDGSCTAFGTTERLPSPVRTSSIWKRSGEEWQAVFHGEIPIIDPSAAMADEGNDPQEKDARPEVGSTAAQARAPAKPSSDPISEALIAAERGIWDAWMKHDAGKINELTSDEISFVNLFGTYLPDKASTVADWTSEACEVTSFMLSKGIGSLISPTVGILTVTGTVHGSCGGKDISGQRIHATTVYVKHGEAWKWAFGFNSPN